MSSPASIAIRVLPFDHLLAAAPAGSEGDWTIGNVWALFAIVISLLAFFVLVVFMLMMGRRRRRRLGDRPKDDPVPVDAWAEAGRRAEAYPSRRGED